MEDTILSKKSGFEITLKSTFSKENVTFSSRSFEALLARHATPASHRKIADNYNIVKRIFKFQTSAGSITQDEQAFLKSYNFKTLVEMTPNEMYKELSLLRNWSSSKNQSLREDSDKLLQIRANELKIIENLSHAVVSNEIYQGFVVLANYFAEISKYPV